ncbi:ATP phosphoribosyltransferase regulatory subunit [Virgibacillus oceani]|uniref:ATP phosphoribosyltransferase regulatory subunit n=1 Tax=Virgibacillus oceani TaxID=1479511 RepID=A0A917HJD2_9BACI|nr:ATP phosphoribosyltransferase regulatory subunit [Virgibacillus oceani]GGG81544.1 ATP phosphoribosyltransferase regulatory subunit [Virgibacillus oceani]
MQLDVFESMNTISLEDYQRREHLLAKIKDRFSTYGYQQIQTPTFEQYDLYKTITGTVNRDEMIKVIDPTGKVLVLRPDVTIPITRIIATNKQIPSGEKRFYYISNVFRNSIEQQDKKEHTQAGIENFGQNTPPLDAEIIALAIQTISDLGFKKFKLEIGHAGFFKELLKQINISEQNTSQLQQMIQAKNFSELKPFLETLSIHTDVKVALQQIPFLYGRPEDVMKRAGTVILNERMNYTLSNLIEVYELLKIYGLEEFVSFDLGLINHMDYYSGIIFQGFVENFGKPVLMGGRYDTLAEQFDTDLPAIGFACDVDAIFDAMEGEGLFSKKTSPLDIMILYTPAKQREALTAAQELRELGYRVITSLDSTPTISEASFIVRYKENVNTIKDQHNTRLFYNQEELMKQLLQNKGEL